MTDKPDRQNDGPNCERCGKGIMPDATPRCDCPPIPTAQPDRQGRDGLAFAQPPVTALHHQAASMFFCWPTNAIDLCKEDSDLPAAIEKLAAFISVWEAKGAGKFPTRDAAEGAALDRENHWRSLEGRDPAPPKPAPDAMREALRDAMLHLEGAQSGFISGCGSDTAWLNKRDEIVNAAIAALAAPVPPADPRDDCASHRLFSEEKMLGGLKDWIRETVPPADGARQWPRVFNVKRAENAWHAEISFARHPTDAELQALEISLRGDRMDLPPPCTGAAEPFAWVVLSDVTGNARMWTRNGDIAKAFAAKHLLKCIELYAAPPVRGREAIARIRERVKNARGAIESGQVTDKDVHGSLTKVIEMLDALHVQPGAGEREAPRASAACSAVSKLLCGEETCTDAGNWRCPQNIEAADEMIVEIVDAVFSFASLSRQAPHSSSEGGR